MSDNIFREWYKVPIAFTALEPTTVKCGYRKDYHAKLSIFAKKLRSHYYMEGGKTRYSKPTPYVFYDRYVVLNLGVDGRVIKRTVCNHLGLAVEDTTILHIDIHSTYAYFYISGIKPE